MKRLNLLDMVKIPLSKRQAEALKRIDAENCDMIVYLTKKEHDALKQKHSREYYDAGCLALKQYYSLSIVDPKNMHAICDKLDPFWHSHILDTVSYEMLCKDIGVFMHHDPLNKMHIQKVEAVRKVYDYTYDTLSKIYGPENLSPEFHPNSASHPTMVCLHDIDTRTLSYPPDVFPLNEEIGALRIIYGHEKRQEMIRQELNKSFN